MADGVGAHDRSEAKAVDAVTAIVKSDRRRVYYSRQIEVWLEATWFHWITNRAVRYLERADFLRGEDRHLSTGGSVRVLWHRSNRYPKRAADRVAGLVQEYSSERVAEALGSRGEDLILEGFARRGFVLRGRGTATFGGRTWTKTAHNLDFVFERDGIVYGIEVKNTLGYMTYDEVSVKLEMCDHLGIKPVFAVRAMPKSWIYEVERRGGYSFVMKYQMYPRLLQELVGRIKGELDLPVDYPRALKSGTMDRFEKWHREQRV